MYARLNVADISAIVTKNAKVMSWKEKKMTNNGLRVPDPPEYDMPEYDGCPYD